MQFGEDPSISHVANRFMGTGLLRAPLPGKLRRPLLSAMVRAAGWDSPTPSWGGGGFCRPALRCLGVCVSVKLNGVTVTAMRGEPRRASSFLRPGWGRTAVGNRAGAKGATAELPVPTTPLRRCEGWRECRCRTGAPGEAVPVNAGAGTLRRLKKKLLQFRF